MRLLLIDNYDSFTFNLADYLSQDTTLVEVVRHDDEKLACLEYADYNAIVISPGPGQPTEIGHCNKILDEVPEQFPLLGICLGHQAIGLRYGYTIEKALKPVHGKTSFITHDQDIIFSQIPSLFEGMRYHSLYLREGKKSKGEVIARSKDGVIMAVRFSRLHYGVQFHPESVLTTYGQQLLDNWKKIVSGG